MSPNGEEMKLSIIRSAHRPFLKTASRRDSICNHNSGLTRVNRLGDRFEEELYGGELAGPGRP
jgi:hypothetical protein